MAMPVTAFFTMLKTAREMNAYERLEDCDVAAITICNSKWYDEVKSRYIRILENMKPVDEPVRRGPPVLDAGSVEAKDFMFNLFRSIKRK